MTTAQAIFKPVKTIEQESKRHHTGKAATLADFYTDSLTSRKTHTTIGISTAQALGTHTEFETQQNMAHTSSTDSSMPPSSTESSPEHWQSSTEAEASPAVEGGAVYCNIQELKSKIQKSSPEQSIASLTPPGVVTPPTAQQEAIYSNLLQSSSRESALPPRDIQRALNPSVSLPVGQQQLPPQPPILTETPYAVNKQITQTPHSTSEVIESPPTSASTCPTQESKDESVASLQEQSPGVTRPPTTAPKPRSKQKPGECK